MFLSRYRSRWEKIEEVERIRDLDRKREEFRRKIDEKRARMAQMTEAERDEAPGGGHVSTLLSVCAAGQ